VFVSDGKVFLIFKVDLIFRIEIAENDLIWTNLLKAQFPNGPDHNMEVTIPLLLKPELANTNGYYLTLRNPILLPGIYLLSKRKSKY
jgi:hypothetical protein